MAQPFSLEEAIGKPTSPASFSLEEALPKKAVVQDPLNQATNRVALERIGQSIPEPVKEAAFSIADAVGNVYDRLPEPVKEAAGKTGNFLLDAIDYLQRPFQAAAVGAKAAGAEIKEAAKGTDAFGLELPTLFKAATKPGAAEKVGQAALRGLTGKEKASTQELLSDEFRKNNPVSAAAIGFLGDAVVDPLNIANPFGVAKKAIDIGANSVSVPTRLTDNELFRSIAASANVTFGEADKARDLFNKYRYLRDKARNEGVRNAKQLDNEIKALSKQTNIPVNELKAKILHDIETANLSDEAIGAIEQRIIDRNRQLLEEQRAAGVEIGDLGPTYMPHVLSKEADEILNNSGVKNLFGLRPSARTPQGISREIEGTVKEINAKNLYGTSKFFQDDPAILSGYADFNAANAIAGRKFLDDAQQLGVRADDAPANYVTVPEIPGVKFDPITAKLLNRSYRTLTSQEEMSKLLKLYDGAQNWWKMWSLGVRPAYHTKNVIGNVWNSYLGGLSDPRRFYDAGLFQTKLATNNLTGKVAGRDAKELYEAMSTRGVFGEGQYSGDIVRNLEKEIQGGGRNPLTLSTDNPVLQAGFKVGQTLEDNARIALFIDQVKKGKTYDQAGRHVQKYLFDYGDISPFEQSVLKRFMPFYTWSRKNIPLQLEAIALHPDKINKLNLAKENIQAANNVQTPDPSEVPGYVVDGMPIYTGRSEDTIKYLPLANLLPLADLSPFFKFLNTQTEPSAIERGKLDPAISSALANASPFIKAPIEYLANYDFFRRKQIEEFEGQKTDMLGVPMPIHLAKLLSNIVLLSEVDRLNPGGIFGTREKNVQTGEIKSTPSIFGVERESRTDLPQDERTFQAVTGIRVQELNMEEAMARRAKKLTGDINTLRGYIRRAAAQDKSREVDTAAKALEWYLDEMDKLEAQRVERMGK